MDKGDRELRLMCSQQVRDTLSSCRRSERTTAFRVGCPAVEPGARASLMRLRGARHGDSTAARRSVLRATRAMLTATEAKQIQNSV